MGKTKIEWCTFSFNPWLGCTKIGKGGACEHCYAESMSKRFDKAGWGDDAPRVVTGPENWLQPFRWDRNARRAGRIDTVFSLSMGDIWDNKAEAGVRHSFFRVMEETPNLLYLLLSKRIGNSIKMCSPHMGNINPELPVLPRNTALGATVVTQEEWDRDVPKLIEAARILGPRFTFVSIEPMLGPITMTGDLPNWVICGGESGPNARPIYPGWATSLRDQCAHHRVPFFFKQWGEWEIDTNPGIMPDDNRCHTWIGKDGKQYHPSAPEEQDCWAMRKVGKKVAGNFLFGRQHLDRPVEIMVYDQDDQL